MELSGVGCQRVTDPGQCLAEIGRRQVPESHSKDTVVFAEPGSWCYPDVAFGQGLVEGCYSGVGDNVGVQTQTTHGTSVGTHVRDGVVFYPACQLI